MNLADLILGAACGGVGTAAAFIMEMRKHPPQPLCACNHHKCFHQGGGICSRCQCKGYIGPRLDADGRPIKEDRHE